MSKIWMPGGGGGGDGSDDCTISLPDVPKGLKAVTADSDDEAREGTLDTVTTAADSHVLAGESYMKFNSGTNHWEKRTGAQANRGAWTARIGVNGKVAIPAGSHNGAGYVDQAITDRGAWNGSVGMNGATAVPEGYHNGGGKVNGPAVTQRGAWTSGLGVNGTVNIPEGYHNGSGYVNQSIATKGAQTFTPGTSNQSIGAGNYLTGAQTILGDPNLISANIAKGKTIFGKVGTFEGVPDDTYYLYNNGIYSPLLLGFNGDWYEIYNYTGSFAFEASRITFTTQSGTNGGGSVQVTGQKTIDVSNHNYLNLRYSIGSITGAVTRHLELGIGKSSGTAAMDKNTQPGGYVLRCNISTLSGFVSPPIIKLSQNRGPGTTNLHINQIWLSKS